MGQGRGSQNDQQKAQELQRLLQQGNVKVVGEDGTEYEITDTQYDQNKNAIVVKVR